MSAFHIALRGIRMRCCGTTYGMGNDVVQMVDKALSDEPLTRCTPHEAYTLAERIAPVSACGVVLTLDQLRTLVDRARGMP